MKIIFTLLFVISTLFSAHIDEFASNMGYYRDYDKALEKAKIENKPVMLVVVGDYCPWCRKFERKTLQKQKIAFKVQKDFIPVIVDKNLDKEKYPKKYFPAVVPNVYFINPHKNESMFESLGYVKKKPYAKNLNRALSLYEKVK